MNRSVPLEIFMQSLFFMGYALLFQWNILKSPAFYLDNLV